METSATQRPPAARPVLAVLASGQFLMTLDSSVMNVSMADVAADLNTPITGIQVAITLYTLVMATSMITGGRIGTRLGRRRAFGVGLVVYGAGSLTTALTPNPAVLLLGWSLLEGLGAALILPAIVALVAANFPGPRRSAAYGMVAAAGAIGIAAGPLIGGTVTTYASWRYVFAGEVVLVVVILLALRRLADVSPTDARMDPVGTLLSVLGLGALVYGVLRAGEWGWVQAAPQAPRIFGLSPVIWLIVSGLVVLYGFLRWESRLAARGREPLVDPALLRNRRLTGGLGLFFAQFLVQGGVFFTVPLFLSVVLELSAVETGLRILPLSIALVLTAIGIPRFAPRAGPRRVVRLGLAAMVCGIVVLIAGLDPTVDARVVTVPMILLGLGLGALSAQLGAVTVSAVPDSRSAEVGGLQNTGTSLGTSVGTALMGSVLIAALTTSVLDGITGNPAVPESVQQQATTRLTAGAPFVSTTQLQQSLGAAGVPAPTAQAIVEANADARLSALRAALMVAAVFAVLALFGTGRLPRAPVGGRQHSGGEPRRS
ncbi:MFS transporter [Nocardia mexicana]|uniref:MFS transporter n=1 Tax=Nocardia mexicana TaxID=279262 RepID=UPI00083158FC|nr:MFS transporter [Nocardia mexicana]